jgi:hypothetical protein
LKKQKSGFRKLPGTEMVKPEVVYTPTTSPWRVNLMRNLEIFLMMMN